MTILDFLRTKKCELIEREQVLLPRARETIGEEAYQADLKITKEWQYCLDWLIRNYLYEKGLKDWNADEDGFLYPTKKFLRGFKKAMKVFDRRA